MHNMDNVFLCSYIDSLESVQYSCVKGNCYDAWYIRPTSLWCQFGYHLLVIGRMCLKLIGFYILNNMKLTMNTAGGLIQVFPNSNKQAVQSESHSAMLWVQSGGEVKKRITLTATKHFDRWGFKLLSPFFVSNVEDEKVFKMIPLSSGIWKFWDSRDEN